MTASRDENDAEIETLRAFIAAYRREGKGRQQQAQREILAQLFPEQTPPQAASGEHAVDLYRQFQTSRIPEREQHIDAILQAVADQDRVRHAEPRTRHWFTRLTTRAVSTAIAATVLITLATTLILRTQGPTPPSVLQPQHLEQLAAVVRNNPTTSAVNAPLSHYSFSEARSEAADAFVAGVFSIDIPVYLAAADETRAKTLLRLFSRRFGKTHAPLVEHVNALSAHRPFDIERFRTQFESEIQRSGLLENQSGYYLLGRWVEALLLASQSGTHVDDTQLVSTMLALQPAPDPAYPDEINRVLYRIHEQAVSALNRDRLRDIRRSLELIKGYF